MENDFGIKFKIEEKSKLSEFRSPLDAVRQELQNVPIKNLRYHLIDLRTLDKFNTYFYLRKKSFDINKVSKILKENFIDIYLSGLNEKDDSIGESKYFEYLFLTKSFSNWYFFGEDKFYIDEYKIYRKKYIKLIKKQIKKNLDIDIKKINKCLFNAYLNFDLKILKKVLKNVEPKNLINQNILLSMLELHIQGYINYFLKDFIIRKHILILLIKIFINV